MAAPKGAEDRLSRTCFDRWRRLLRVPLLPLELSFAKLAAAARIFIAPLLSFGLGNYWSDFQVAPSGIHG